VLIAGAAGLDVFGPRTGDTTARGGGFTVGLEYPAIARSGEPAPLVLSISSEQFGDSVMVRFCASFFEHLDFQAWYPSPSGESSETDWIVYEFDPPPNGQTLRVALDARVAPGQLGGRDACEVSVLDQGEPVATATWTTWRMP
jgi:hypothetical protein